MPNRISKEAHHYVHTFEKTERVAAGRLLMRLTKLIDSQKYVAGRNFYAYIRYLDDIVDSGQNVTEVQTMLRQEILFLEQLLLPDGFEKAQNQTDPQWIHELLLEGLESIRTDETKEKIITNLIAGVKGFYLDTIQTKYQKPLPDITQVSRNKLALLPYLHVLSLVLFDKVFVNPEKEEVFTPLINAWAHYDALRDYPEDFAAGLVLFPREVLNRHAVELQPEQHIPETFTELHKDFKQSTIRKISQQIKSVTESNLPLLFRLAFQSYFLVAITKLSLTPPPKPKTLTFGRK